MGDIIGEGLDIHMNLSQKERNDLIEQTMKEVELDPKYRFKYPHEFSGGQRQRIAIARTLLKDPDIILLDEASSSLDYKTETEIKKNLNNFNINKTVISVAHRLSSIEDYDLIYFLDEGRVLELSLIHI